MRDKLKPCPFCGGKAEMDWDSMTEFGGHEHQTPCIECDCGIQFDFKFDHPMDDKCTCCHDLGGELARLWNARADKYQAFIAKIAKQQGPLADEARDLLN